MRTFDYSKVSLDDIKGFTKNESFFGNKLIKESKEEKGGNTKIKNIIVFTNDRDPKTNKTLKNIVDFIEKRGGIKLYTFVTAKTEVDDSNKLIKITDGKTELDLKDINNDNTIVFSRLGVYTSPECAYTVKLLQEYGLLVLNPVHYMEIASDKYETAKLLSKYNIPQPEYTLMTKSLLDDFHKQMKDIYKDYNKDKDGDKEIVIKILDGHGGTGVFLLPINKTFAVLQAIFAIDPERKLLIQKKEEADGGDIRVHVLTLRDRQEVLAVMKRNKISSDFRSNVSLGATAEGYELSEEQKEIALKTAKVSKLPWCAVDIMPTKDGKNLVLEINSSPGTAGISEVINKNFIEVLFDKLDNSSEFVIQDRIAGRYETVTVNWDGTTKKDYLCKLDTGNSTGASTIEVGKLKIKDNKITFKVEGKEITKDIVGTIEVTNVDGTHKRHCIIVDSLSIGNRVLRNVKIAVIEERKRSTNMLLNCDSISRLGYVVHPLQKHLLTKEISKVDIK